MASLLQNDHGSLLTIQFHMLTQVEDANARTTSNPHPPPSKAASCCQVLTPVAVQKAVYAVCLIWRLLLPIPIPFITDFCTYDTYIMYNIYNIQYIPSGNLCCIVPVPPCFVDLCIGIARENITMTPMRRAALSSPSLSWRSWRGRDNQFQMFQVQWYMIWSQYMEHMIQVYTSI